MTYQDNKAFSATFMNDWAAKNSDVCNAKWTTTPSGTGFFLKENWHKISKAR